ncbi:related to GAP1-amino acid transport protein [Phialocephala subalpina]|uniref:Related to GAP1-amino acid transport protein n=1 Tax=Phialocephala subalpina TaxID=576137 RepID=A0A1L7XPW2_9HELO|nr:related to GAP1-amino acid transport protein [Phialocephala subalpina]
MADLEKTTSVKATSVPTSSVENGVGNIGPVREYVNESAAAANSGQLVRKFKARHVQMIALAGNIGSGVFISLGAALQVGGAPGILIGYPLICVMALTMLTVMGEAVCLFPTSGSFIDHAARFVDPSLGFAIGFCEWFGALTVVAAEGAVFPVIISYWTTEVPAAALMTIYLVVVYAFHLMPNRWFAEFEFCTGAVKVVTMAIVLLTSVAILPVFPNGFRGVARVFLYASWATGGQEILGIAAGETKMPRYDMPRASVNLFIRIIVIFGSSCILVSVLVPYNEPLLLNTSNVAASPFVIAMGYAGIKVLPDIINVVLLICLCCIGSESIFIASRIQTAMSRMGMFPAIFGRVDSKGRPMISLISCFLIATAMTYMCVSTTGAIAFNWFSSISATTTFFAWMVIPVTNWCMHRALKAQNDPAFSLPYANKNSFWPFESIFLFVSTLFTFACTFYVSVIPDEGSPNAETFFETMLCFPVFVVAYLGYKLWFRTKVQDPMTADLVRGGGSWIKKRWISWISIMVSRFGGGR